MKLELNRIYKSYGGVGVLQDVSLETTGGKVVSIVGANGAGKSTLIRILAGAHQADSGELRLDGQPLDLRSPRDAIANGIHTVYQELSVVPELSVTENLLIGTYPRNRGRLIDWRAAHARAQEVLDDVGFGSINPRSRTGSLSVAKQQMVEIAKALVHQPRILVLDEPSAVLGGADLDALFELIERLRRRGVLIIYVSHRLAEVMTLADEIVVMKDGRFVAERTPSETDEDELIRLMAGRNVGQIYPSRRETPGDVVLRVDGLSRSGEFEDITFEVRAGEVVGLFGLVGSGRSEMAAAVFGATCPREGRVAVQGRSGTFASPSQAIASGIALVTEDRKRTGLVLLMSVQDNISLTTMRSPILDLRGMRKTSRTMVDDLGIQPKGCASKPVWQLSGGNQQKVVLAKWLLTRPRVLILDEPTRGVDMATRVDIYRMIDELARSGVGVLLISSDLSEVIGATDRVLVMNSGRLAGERGSAHVSEDEILACSIGTHS